MSARVKTAPVRPRRSTTKEDLGREAWALFWELFSLNKPRMLAASAEFDLAPMQMHALRYLEPGSELPMSALAQWLHCDASNVTGIVDRLEARGLIERRNVPGDRRVKLLAVTAEGKRVRSLVLRRLEAPPEGIAALPLAEQRTLRDLLRRACEGTG